MLQVSLREGESQEGLLSRFQKMIQRDGVLREARQRKHFISEREKLRAAERKAARRLRRQQARQNR